MNMIPTDAAVHSMLHEVDIPPCPAILVDVSNELRKDDPDQREIARLIGKDVSLAGHVIQIANSPAFSAGRHLDSLTQALAMLGTRQVMNLVVVQLLKTAMSGPSDPALEHFWETSVKTAGVAAELAKRLRRVRPDIAYTFGLFHDCGIPLMLQRFPETMEVLAKAAITEEASFTDIEDRHLGTNHAVVGYFLAKRWHLPAEITEAIQLHHDYSIFGSDNRIGEQAKLLIGTTVLAEYITGLHCGETNDGEWTKAAPQACELFDLSLGAVDDLIEDMLDWLG
jgi:HD-like signal output (HDOD) protein